MKFAYTLAPIASLALAVSGESPVTQGYNKPVSFSSQGLQKALDVKTNGPNGDVSGAVSSVMNFLKTNPTIVKSVLKVADQPKHKRAKDEVISQGIRLYPQLQGGNVNISELKVKVIDFVYSHPGVLDLAQQVGKQVFKDHPAFVDNLQPEIEELAKSNPTAFKKIKKQMIEFSEEHNEAYEKGFEMLLKSALLDPRLSAKVAKGALKIDQIICEGSGSNDCDCGGEYLRPEVKASEVQETSEPEVEVPEVESEVPEIQETSRSEPAVDNKVPEAEAPELKPEAVEYARPNTKNEPIEPKVETEVEYEAPEVETPVDVQETSEPEIRESVQYERPTGIKPVPIPEPTEY